MILYDLFLILLVKKSPPSSPTFFPIAANVVDSCSSQDQGLNAALKSLLTTNQTCVNAPLLLGKVEIETRFINYSVNRFASSVIRRSTIP